MENENSVKAKIVYDYVIRAFDEMNWSYDRHDNDLVVSSGVKGDDFPVEFIMVVQQENQVVQFLSRLPFEMSEDKRVEGAIAACVANNGLCNGSFDYNFMNGEITFRLTTSYIDTTPSTELIKHMILVASSTVDRYNDKFFMLSKGMLTIQQLIEQEEN